MHIRTVVAKSILNKTGIPGFTYCLNPYIGCQHACLYCYAASITQRFSPHPEPWGQFVDIKINTPALLADKLEKAKLGVVYLSSITDPYQPVEKKYRLTRKSLELLLSHQFPVNIQTKSCLVLRDLDLIKKFKRIEVGLTVTTHDEHTRRLFEPGAASIAERISTLRTLREGGIRTYAFIAPLLPLDPQKLMNLLAGTVDYILIDKLNYPGQMRWFYKKHRLERYLKDPYFQGTAQAIQELGKKRAIQVETVF